MVSGLSVVDSCQQRRKVTRRFRPRDVNHMLCHRDRNAFLALAGSQDLWVYNATESLIEGFLHVKETAERGRFSFVLMRKGLFPTMTQAGRAMVCSRANSAA